MKKEKTLARLFCEFRHFLRGLINMVFGPLKESQGGELTVSGNEKMQISLNQEPVEVEVYFKDEPDVQSCNPHMDELTYNVVRFDGYKLHIYWNVEGVRQIAWHVKY